MTDLRQSTVWLLRAHDAAKWLRLADSYIQAFNRMPQQFVLPREHAVLKPVIDSFATDTQAFAAYIRAVRDGSEGATYDEIHDLYRTVSVRALQTQRRNRIRKAALLLVPRVEEALGRVLRYDDEVVLAKFVEQRWGVMRLDAMAEARNELSKKRLPSEDRAALLENFWKGLDEALDTGDVPLGMTAEESMQDILKLFV